MKGKAGFQNISRPSLTVVFFLLAAPALILAQTPPQPNPAAAVATPSTAATPQQDPVTADSGLAPIYGVQGVLIETLDGKTVSAQSVEQTFNPASAVKLATALVALRTFGPDHRFTTGFWTDGSFDKATGQIVGNIYVTGQILHFILNTA